MKKIILIIILITSTISIYSQDEVYAYTEKDIVNRIIIDKNYFLMSSYKFNSNEFIKQLVDSIKKRKKDIL